MKTTLSFPFLREKEVPAPLDAAILAAAAFHLKRRKRRKVWSLCSGAAAACVLCLALAGKFYYGTPYEAPKTMPAAFSTSELLAMSDFTVLEQETFVLDQSSYASAFSGEAAM